MSRGCLFWLGSPRVEIDGRPVRLETRKITALLAYLSVEGRAVSRERLAALFWPEYDSVRAPANLRRALASLQAAVGDTWFTVDRDSIAFTGGEDVRVDIVDFLGAVRDLRSGWPESEAAAPREVDALADAISLYRGDFLEGFNLKDSPDFDQWQMLMREELLHQASWALERMAECDAASGRFDRAIEWAQRWLALDNLNEPAHRTLMFLFARSGKRSAALRQYELCVKLLHDELGQEPDEQTAALAERIRLRKLDAPAAKRSPPIEKTPAALLTKLTPPRLRPHRVERSRLFGLLDQGTNRPVTLLSAPAGFGKTTLLCEWVARCALPVAWISIEESDDSPLRLLSAAASALGQLDPRIGAEALAMLRSMQVPPLSRVIESLVNDLAREPAPRLLVLDDYHRIHNADAQRLIAQLVEQMPPELHLFIATRVDPALPLPRLRVRDHLVEVRAEELRFSPAESAAFLRDVMQLDLVEKDVESLEARTEGWAAGLQMAALSLRGRDDPGEYIRSFEGSHRYVMDYLLEEVLEKLDPAVREFLLSTSILGQFCDGLCDEVCGIDGSQAMLEQLEQENLFLVALDDHRRWFRYHHLFADLLRHRLRQEREPGVVEALHGRAGRWLEVAGDYDRSMHHYLSGHHYDAALKLMDAMHGSILVVGGLSTLLDWSARIPVDEVCKSVRGCVTLGSIYAWAGRERRAEDHFRHAEALLESQDPGVSLDQSRRLSGRIAIMRAFVADIAGRTEQAISLAETAQLLLAADDQVSRPLVPYILGKAYRYQGDLDRSEHYTNKQVELGLLAGNSMVVAGAVHELVWIARLRGRLGEAERAIAVFDAMPKKPGSEGPAVKVHADRAELARERGLLEEADRLFAETLERVERWKLPSDLYFCRLSHCRFAISSGDLEAAQIDIDHCDALARESLVYATMFPLLEAERIRVWLAAGRIDDAMDWLVRYPIQAEKRPVNREILLISRARVLLAAGRTAEAGELLEELARDAEAGGRHGRLIEICILAALCAAADGRQERALDLLGTALGLAEPEGYVRLFLDEGRTLVDLLDRYARDTELGKLDESADSSPRTPYSRRLCSAFGG